MKEFKTHIHLLYSDSLKNYLASENVCDTDLILTNEFLYKEHVSPLALPCPCIFLESYASGEPTTDTVDKIRMDIPAQVTRIFAIGGGSVLDTAKMLSLKTSGGKTEDLFLSEELPERIYQIYALPTTCGTGSEVTNACAVELSALHTKRGLNNDLIFPHKSVLIPELITGLPYRFFATSSIDALIHATESFLSPKASPVSELFSKEAIRLIIEGYLYIIKEGLEKWRDRAPDFLNASTFAGLAFCSAGCAAVHALSYPLGGGHHIPHGEANQLVFAETMRKYKAKQPVGKINALEELYGQILGTSPEEALESAFALFDKVQPRKPLREYGIAEQELPGFAEGVQAGQQRLLGNNYVPLSVQEMLEIYQAIY